MTSVDDILNFKKDEETLYAILGCDESSSVEQINAEFKARALQYHPDKNEGDKEAEAKFQKLKEAKEILTDPEKRKNYDKWLNSGIAISYKQWLGMKEHVHQSMHWMTFKTKDRMLEGEGAGSGKAPPANRRASEGGANIHWGARSNVQWDSQASSDVVNKFRNYEI
ncbi:J domain-containing protein [Cimex lectularius]|uniref:J domain-containing protein n=1 Tax=Cimex lectularius TaxID=79782 RepID=A0A8I6RYA6_CIMLE|nr:J domain-containing protein [Cimex lectularius]